MNISIEIGGPLADAINNLAAALVSAKQTDTIIEKASRKAKKPEPQSAAQEPETAPEQTASDTTETSTPVAFTRDDAKKAVLTVAKEKGHDVASALLARFGAKKISEVADADIEAIIAASKEL